MLIEEMLKPARIQIKAADSVAVATTPQLLKVADSIAVVTMPPQPLRVVEDSIARTPVVDASVVPMLALTQVVEDLAVGADVEVNRF